MLLEQYYSQKHPQKTPCNQRQSGFNLVELIATMAIAAILLGVGVPSLLRMINGSLITGYVDAMTGGLAVARTEAIVEKNSVSICKSADLLNCDNSVDWHDGWIVFIDANGNQSVDGADRIVRVHEALSAQTKLVYSGGTYLQYGYKGDLESSAGSFVFCPQDNDDTLAQGITIATSGRVRKDSGPFNCP
ncbi:MAG: GspH/FimT family pseudopilin [Pseudomonadales bacterium]|nr:GspH/FimT family pseudopilin [Pseudomonadales bacterium]